MRINNEITFYFEVIACLNVVYCYILLDLDKTFYFLHAGWRQGGGGSLGVDVMERLLSFLIHRMQRCIFIFQIKSTELHKNVYILVRNKQRTFWYLHFELNDKQTPIVWNWLYIFKKSKWNIPCAPPWEQMHLHLCLGIQKTGIRGQESGKKAREGKMNILLQQRLLSDISVPLWIVVQGGSSCCTASSF